MITWCAACRRNLEIPGEGYCRPCLVEAGEEPQYGPATCAQRIILGDCLEVFRDVRGLGAIVTDMPAGIGFMSRDWDKDRGGRARWIAYWAERLAVARDACEDDAGGLFWALPRTSHWTATAVEDAGWRIRDVITHHFGTGWNKAKGLLRPASEHWILAFKGSASLDIDACRVPRGERPLMVHNTSTVQGQSLAGHSTGASANGTTLQGSLPTNLVLSHAESCERVGTRKVRASVNNGSVSVARQGSTYGAQSDHPGHDFASDDSTETVDAFLCAVGCDCGASWLAEAGGKAPRCACGREAWWCCPVAEMDAQSGQTSTTGIRRRELTDGRGGMFGLTRGVEYPNDQGNASRFFPRFGYHAKAPSAERHAGCEDLFWRADKRNPFGFVQITKEEWETTDPKERAEGNVHPTVKRLALMRWLHKLTGAKRIGDLCAGSGSGAVAAYLDGIDWIGAEVCPEAIVIAEARLKWWRGLSFAAREAFLSEDVMPKAEARDERQGELFARCEEAAT